MKRILALALAVLTVFSLAGCVVDRAEDMAQVVAVVGDRSITKQELYDEMQAYMDGQGYGINVFDEDMDSATRKTVDEFAVDYLNYMVMEEICVNIVDATMPLTEDEIKEMNDYIDSYISLVQFYYLGYDSSNGGEYDGDLEADTEAYFAENIMPLDQMRVQVERETKLDKLYTSVVKDVVADDAQVKEVYDFYLDEQKDAAASSDNEYQAAISDSNGTVGAFVIYKAEGYRMVSHILIAFTDDETKAIDAKMKAIDEERDILDDAQKDYDAAKKAYDAAVTAGDEEEQAKQQTIMEDKQAVIDAQNKKIQDMMLDYQDYRADMAKDHVALAEDIIARVDNGESFEELSKEYNDDPGSKQSPYNIYGYCVPADGSGFDTDFAAAVLLMDEEGALSEPVISDYGVHIIRLNYGTDACALPLDLVEPLVKDEADNTAQSKAWDEYIDTYIEENGIKIYEDRATWK